jgi:hypothetical protein
MKIFIAAILLGILAPVTLVLATPTNEEILRSFNENMDQAPDYALVIPWLFAAGGAIAIVMYFRQYQKRQAVPKPLNHPRKLVKEVVKNMQMDPLEMKKLSAQAKELGCDSPLTLLLCPSLTRAEEAPTADE